MNDLSVRDDAFSAAFDKGDLFENNQLNSPLPQGIKPFNHLIAVMKIAPRKMSKGGIILSDKSRDGEDFMNNIGRICAIGPACFRSPWWRERGYHRVDDGSTYNTTTAIPSDPMAVNGVSLQLPKVGDLIRMSGVRNRQYKLKGTWIVEIDDTQIRGWVDEADVYDYQFWS